MKKISLVKESVIITSEDAIRRNRLIDCRAQFKENPFSKPKRTNNRNVSFQMFGKKYKDLTAEERKLYHKIAYSKHYDKVRVK